MSKVEELPDEITDAEIDALQKEINDRVEGKSDYKFDPDGWKTMPIFMNEFTEDDVNNNEQVAALSAMMHDGLSAEEIAEDKKKAGNTNMQFALQPGHDNPQNLARAAALHYTAGIEAGCGNQTLNAQLFCNRSMANFIMENYGKGLKDAQRAILIDVKYVKAYNRGAKCAARIRKWAIAKELIKQGLSHCDGEKDQATIKDFELITESVEKGIAQDAEKEKTERLKNRAAAAKSNNLVKDITSKGIKISPKAEVSSEQWAQTGNAKPFFDEEGVLHIPILFMYDEPQMTDFLQDIPTDVTMLEVLEGSGLMPFPWDTTGRYATPNHFLCVFIVDDGVNMPKYYSVDMSWTLFEVMRQKEYTMPGLVPTFHLVAKGSDILKQWGLE